MELFLEIAMGLMLNVSFFFGDFGSGYWKKSTFLIRGEGRWSKDDFEITWDVDIAGVLSWKSIGLSKL